MPVVARLFVPLLAAVLVLWGGVSGLWAGEAGESFSLRASHRALYETFLHSDDGGSGIAAAEGASHFELIDDCDAWSTYQRSFLTRFDNAGNALFDDFRFVSWEEKAGGEFRFSTYRFRGTGQDEDSGNYRFYGGTARAPADGSEGQVVYTDPPDTRRTLPVPTLFPIQMLLRLLDAAEGGDVFLNSSFFAGDSDDAVYDVSIVIGREIPPASGKGGSGGAVGEALRFPELSELRSWPVTMAMYRGRQSEPDSQMSFRLFENGISGDALFDYGNFVLEGRLVQLVLLDGCGG